jgi:hypothetical protein
MYNRQGAKEPRRQANQELAKQLGLLPGLLFGFLASWCLGVLAVMVVWRLGGCAGRGLLLYNREA